MKTYRVKPGVEKRQLLESGFTYHGYNVVHFKKRVYKDMITLRLSVDYSEENDPATIISLWDECNNQEYSPLYCPYGVNRVRDRVLEEYQRVMNRLVRKGLFLAED